MFRQRVLTPLGPLLVCSDGACITEIRFSEDPVPELPDALTERAVQQLSEYFSGTRRVFDLPLRIEGTPFQAAVYRALCAVPFGQTISYGLLAAKAGFPGAARAVGTAMRKNRLVIVVPCHRVLSANGLGGYGCGLDKKRWLLRLEGSVFPESN